MDQSPTRDPTKMQKKGAKEKKNPFASFPPLRGEGILQMDITADAIGGKVPFSGFPPLTVEENWKMESSASTSSGKAVLGA